MYKEKGRLIIEFMTSLDKIVPSVKEAGSVALIRSPPCGPAEKFNEDHCPLDRFMDAGNEYLLVVEVDQDLGDPPNLPLEFIKTFLLDKVFRREFRNANFSLALTGLDYLSILEKKRKSSLREAAQRLGISRDTWKIVLQQDPLMLNWVTKVIRDERIIEVYYAKLFINVRIWVSLRFIHIYE